MIPADLLDKLREKDPELWDKLQEQFEKLKAYQEDRVYEVDVIATFECLLQMSGWILQGLLQEAIRAREWSYKQICLVRRGTPNEIFYYAEIDKGIAWDSPLHFEGHGSTEAEGLLRAYLATP